MALILRHLGISVVTAKSGKEAIKCVKKNDIRIVLTDIKMPHMNGIELCRKLRKIIPDVPLVLMTAYTRDDLIDEGIKLGVCDVLYKPFEMGHVTDLIEKRSLGNRMTK
ncbi:MAG: response regulator [Methanosarcinaceae archaeon]|nr:response regulator [Methanosarcinaceae archaeon]